MARVATGVFVLCLATAAVVLGFEGSTPHKLPGAALGSAFVLHSERAAGLFAIFLLLGTVIVRGFQGELPIELSGRGVKWTPKESTELIKTETANAIDELGESITALRGATTAAISDLTARLDNLENRP